MSALEEVLLAQDKLLAALDARDVAAIEQASQALAEAVVRAKSSDWGAAPQEAQAHLDHGLRQNEAARVRINCLSDWNRQKIDRLAELRGSPANYHPKQRGF
jgi:regulation of enolase protein 1 (concanavalin A-like superfamily)